MLRSIPARDILGGEGFRNSGSDSLRQDQQSRDDPYFQKYMRGLSEENLGTWLDDFREGLRSVPYPDEQALRAELDQIGAPKSQSPAAFLKCHIFGRA